MPTLRRLTMLATAVALAADTAAHGTAVSPPRECGQDAPTLWQMQEAAFRQADADHRAWRRANPSAAATRGFGAQAARRPLRVKVSTLDMTTAGRFCINSKYPTAPDLWGGELQCPLDGSQDLTLVKREFLVKVLLPAAVARISELFTVVPSAEPLVISDCAHHLIPAAHTTSGVQDADFVLYAAASPVRQGIGAWAAACQFDSATLRPIAGYANVNPARLDPAADFEGQLKTIVHELMHALGFTKFYFGTSRPNSVPTARIERRGTNVTVLRGKATMREGKAFFGCDSLEGVELENEGGGGTKGSHFERRILMEDTMASVSGPKVSRLTLAVFEDMGFYGVNYDAVDPPAKFGRNAGCGFLREKCDTPAGGRDKFFCFTPGRVCTSDRKAVAQCRTMTITGWLPKEFQYFPDEPNRGGSLDMMDYCPVPELDALRLCSVASPPNSWDSYTGDFRGVAGRCIEGVEFGKAPYQLSGASPACVETRCRGDVLDVRLKGDAPQWIECSAGKHITHSGYNGHLICPPAHEICDGSDSAPYIDRTMTPVSPTPVPTPAPKLTFVPAVETAAPGTVHLKTAAPGPWSKTIKVGVPSSHLPSDPVKRNAYIATMIKSVRMHFSYDADTYDVTSTVQEGASGSSAVYLTFTLVNTGSLPTPAPGTTSTPVTLVPPTPVPVIPVPPTSALVTQWPPTPESSSSSASAAPGPVAPVARVTKVGLGSISKMNGTDADREAYLAQVADKLRKIYGLQAPEYSVSWTYETTPNGWVATYTFRGPHAL